MRILVIGGGGREHALVWKLLQSPLVTNVWCAPGNGGISDEVECIPVDVGDVEAIATRLVSNRLDELRATGIWGEDERIREYAYEVLARRQEPEEYAVRAEGMAR